MSYYKKEEEPDDPMERRMKKEGTWNVRKIDELMPMEIAFTGISVGMDIIDIMTMPKRIPKVNAGGFGGGGAAGAAGGAAGGGAAAGSSAAKASKGISAGAKLSAFFVALQIGVGYGMLFGTGAYKEMDTAEVVTESIAITASAFAGLAMGLILGPIGIALIVLQIIGAVIDLFFNPFAVLKNRDLNGVRKQYLDSYIDNYTKEGHAYPQIISPNYLDVDEEQVLTPATKKLFFEYFNEWLRLNGYVNQEDMNQILNENMRKSRRLEQRVQFLSSIVDSVNIPIRVIDKSVLLISGFAEDDIDNYAILLSLVARRKKFELEATRSKEYEFFTRLMADGNFITKLSVNLIFYFCLTIILLY